MNTASTRRRAAAIAAIWLAVGALGAGCYFAVPRVDDWPALVAEHGERERFDLTEAEVALIVPYLQAGRLARE